MENWTEQLDRLDNFFETCSGTMWKLYTTNAPHRQQKKKAIQTNLEDLEPAESLRRLKEALRNQATTSLKTFVIVVVSKATEAQGQTIILQNPEYNNSGSGGSGGSGSGSGSGSSNYIGAMLGMVQASSDKQLNSLQAHTDNAIRYITEISDLKTRHAAEKMQLHREIEDLEAERDFLKVNNSTIGKVVDGLKEPLTTAAVAFLSKMFLGEISQNFNKSGIGSSGRGSGSSGGSDVENIEYVVSDWGSLEIAEKLQEKHIPDLPVILKNLFVLLEDKNTKEEVEKVINMLRIAT